MMNASNTLDQFMDLKVGWRVHEKTKSYASRILDGVLF